MAATENSINDGNFPWDMLKADCLRLICVQLGRRSAVPARREEMLTFLQDVSKNGYFLWVDATLEELESSPSRFKASQKSLGEEPITPTTRKRTRQDDEEEDVHEEGETPGYNTRHKGAKRVRVSDPGPVKYRRGRGHLKESEPPVGAVVKRGRGRPRKNPIVRADGGGKPTFEGVFITPRAMLKAAAGPEEGQDGEDDDGEDEEQLLEDHLLTNPEGDSSNFGGSNKENDPALALQIGICFVPSYKSPCITLSRFHQDELDAEADAEGEADADLILLDAAHASTSV
ncbi:uncharacterized protein LACBIDRAFT_322900 [Laccaria bicolor S238N-H82]|uniref:Predicted protein n=1 Tax=Laccaria bicolor (strain S238N-H82 / ATCC MYA-4686) TaxID=486041 RepID=B0CVI0_LACBS|nr:uncharacterized protein LACBIDRAFT_322900 [Laccaria bicolor S238N-H82]EDR13336.1 predicted protein [Laccaria bicolor S238N-H82]|eukprot:XP_001875834.1 predicted protein [Laccaria bicolor S238N-H82]